MNGVNFSPKKSEVQYLRAAVPLPRWEDKLVRLLYTAQAEGHEPIVKAVERIKTVERIVKQKIVVKESRGQWRPSLQDDDLVSQ